MSTLMWKHSPDTLQPADDMFLLRRESEIQHGSHFIIDIQHRKWSFTEIIGAS